jgi:hypothetical protein
MGKALLFIALTLWITPGVAQTALGGPKKEQNHIGGPITTKSPVVPPRRGEVLVRTAPTTQTPRKH